MKVIEITGDAARRAAISYILSAPVGHFVKISEATRTLEQNAKFHAICSDVAKSGVLFAGKLRNAKQWKVLLVSGHAAATGEGAEIVPGLEGEFVNIRESTALMSKRRGNSLIEYALAWCATNNITMREYRGLHG